MKTSYNMFGVILRRMNKSDLELVRQMRNRPDMMKWMTTNHVISEDEMSAWFYNLPPTQHYYMVEWQNRVVGQVNLKEIDTERVEPGYLFWDDAFSKECGVPRAVLALFVLAFEELECNVLNGITAIENNKALRLAKIFGFEEVGKRDIDGKQFVSLSLSKEKFVPIREKYEVLF